MYIVLKYMVTLDKPFILYQPTTPRPLSFRTVLIRLPYKCTFCGQKPEITPYILTRRNPRKTKTKNTNVAKQPLKANEMPTYQVRKVKTKTSQTRKKNDSPGSPSLTRVTKSYLSVLGTTQISSYITKQWTTFQTHQTGNYPVTCFVSKPWEECCRQL